MNSEEIQQDLQRFKTEMMLYRPFFGDILLRLPIVQDDSIPTACADGRTIRWNSRFFSGLSEAQRHYVLMHEVFHTLLLHPTRSPGHDPKLWNVAADMVVNTMCDMMEADLSMTFREQEIMKRPPKGVFYTVRDDSTAESIYGLLQAGAMEEGDKIRVLRNIYAEPSITNDMRVVLEPDMDLQPGNGADNALSPSEQQAIENEITDLIKSASAAARSSGGSYYTPRQLTQLTKPKPISWRELLKDHLNEVTSDDASYDTPERKYLHMDMILPGHCLTKDGDLDSLWAFVDSSGSIGNETMNEFLAQLYRLVKDFHCEMNICYWDTQVTDVYRKIRGEKHILECQPHHSGGTDINCVFNWMAENRVRPDILLILTDGFFGQVSPVNQKRLRPRDTVLVISNDSESPAYQKIGKVGRLI